MKPGYEPNTLEKSLVHLNEECAEVIKVVSKIQRFGLNNINPDDPVAVAEGRTNRHDLLLEMKDLEQAMSRVKSMLYGAVGSNG